MTLLSRPTPGLDPKDLPILAKLIAEYDQANTKIDRKPTLHSLDTRVCNAIDGASIEFEADGHFLALWRCQCAHPAGTYQVLDVNGGGGGSCRVTHAAYADAQVVFRAYMRRIGRESTRVKLSIGGVVVARGTLQ